MSKTLFVDYRDDGFWAYDVSTGIFLKYLIDIAEAYCTREDVSWLRDCIDKWRFNAVVSDCGLYLDAAWTGDQIRIVVGLVDDACRTLERSEAISAEEMAAWDLLNGEGVFARGDPQFPTAPVVELGRALQALLVGTLPAVPDGTWWFFGVKTGRSTIAQQLS